MMFFYLENITQAMSDKTIENNVRKPIKINLHHFYTKKKRIIFFPFDVETLLFFLYSTLMLHYYPDGIICTYQVHYFHPSPPFSFFFLTRIIFFYIFYIFPPFSPFFHSICYTFFLYPYKNLHKTE